jgi:hypothetical protein
MSRRKNGAPAKSVIDPRLAMRNRQPGLDLLRAIAILLVVFYHAGLFGFVLPYDVQRFGWIGVDLFFVLSGYLIAGQLLSALARGKPPNVRRFYWRRALRILPAFLVIVGICFFLPSWREYPTMPPVWKFLTFTQNLGLRGGTTFSHAWSLCIESQFYLLLPFLLLPLARWRRGHWVVPCAVVLCGIVLRGVIAHANLNSTAPSFAVWQKFIYYPTYARLDPLTMGVCLAAIEHFRPTWWTALTKTARWIWLPALAAMDLAPRTRGDCARALPRGGHAECHELRTWISADRSWLFRAPPLRRQSRAAFFTCGDSRSRVSGDRGLQRLSQPQNDDPLDAHFRRRALDCGVIRDWVSPDAFVHCGRRLRAFLCGGATVLADAATLRETAIGLALRVSLLLLLLILILLLILPRLSTPPQEAGSRLGSRS